MASIRRLKKDIDYLTFSVIGDCFNYNCSIEKENPQVSEIVREILSVRNDLRDKVNAGGKFKDKKETKAYYDGIFRDILIEADKSFEKLSEIVRSK